MAFFFLFTGLLVGASMVSLSEQERDYYYSNRAYMNFLGQKDGLDVYRDAVSGQYYVDDGWDVSRVGKAGFVPHPIERLKQLCTKFQPSNLQWVNFILASFEGREKQLWQNFFEKYELGPKPTEPTWGRGIRKSRWAKYDEELAAWEAKRKELIPQFQEECRVWDEKRKNYDDIYKAQVDQASGRMLLQRALSGANAGFVLQTPVTPVTTTVSTFKARVPAGLSVGETFYVNAGGQMMSVAVPPGAYPGMEVSFQIPAAPTTVYTTATTAAPASVATSAITKTNSSSNVTTPPAAIGTGIQAPTRPPPAIGTSSTSKPPPAIGTSTSAAPPPPALGAASVPAPKKLEQQSSMIWS